MVSQRKMKKRYATINFMYSTFNISYSNRIKVGRGVWPLGSQIINYPFTGSLYKVNFAIHGSQNPHSQVHKQLKGHSQIRRK